MDYIIESPAGYIAALETLAYAWSGTRHVCAPMTASYWLQGYGVNRWTVHTTQAERKVA